MKESQLPAAERRPRVLEEEELGVRESLLRSITADAVNMQHWGVDRVSEIVMDVLRDVGADESTVDAVRVGFARDAIDGWALMRIGQQELSQRFGLPFGLALRVSTVLSQLSAASVRNQSEPSHSPVLDTTGCNEMEALPTSNTEAVSDTDVKLESRDAEGETDVQQSENLDDVVGDVPHPTYEQNPTFPLSNTSENSAAVTTLSETSTPNPQLANDFAGVGEDEPLQQQSSPLPVPST